jgi:hypothetical protein
MKKAITILIVHLIAIAGAKSAFSQTKAETLQWLRSHLKTLVVHDDDSILPYTMTKTYTFYEDAFVVKTERDFYKDTSLNHAPAFSKVWYKDIFTESDTAIMRDIQKEQKEDKAHIYTIWAERVYSIIGREDALLLYWQTFNEPSGLDLYLPGSKAFSIEAIHKLYRLASLMGAKEKPHDLNSEEDSLED